MILFNSSDVAGKRYPMLTGSRLASGIVKTYVYNSISEMIDFCGHVANIPKQEQFFFQKLNRP